jgi:hypothetical protein
LTATNQAGFSGTSVFTADRVYRRIDLRIVRPSFTAHVPAILIRVDVAWGAVADEGRARFMETAHWVFPD